MRRISMAVLILFFSVMLWNVYEQWRYSQYLDQVDSELDTVLRKLERQYGR